MSSIAAAYPILSVSRDPEPNLPCAPALIERVVTLKEYSDDDDTRVVMLEGVGLHPSRIQCRTTTRGYRVELRPERTQFGSAVIVGVRIRKSDPSVTEPCRLRFWTELHPLRRAA